MSDHYSNGFDDFARAFAALALKERPVLEATVDAASHVVHKHVHDTFGDRSKLAELSEATRTDRLRRGFTANDPLLRDGSLLRDSVGRVHEGLEASVGSNEPVMVYSENGFVNARTGRSVPPRPVFRIAFHESEEPVIAAVNESIELLINGRPSSEGRP